MNDIYEQVCKLSEELSEVKNCIKPLHNKLVEQDTIIKKLYIQNLKLAKKLDKS
jgi:hypothetical protein